MGRTYKQLDFLGWKFTITPIRFILTGFVAICAAIIVVRLLTGFGLVTNLNDQWPWGLWIAFDDMVGVALAGGGYGSALLVYSFRYQKYEEVARGALLTSLFGYILVMVGLLLDIGQWHNFWRPMVSMGYTSVLFAVLVCVSIYVTVAGLQFFCEIVTERISERVNKIAMKIVPFLIFIGLIFPVIHQATLGGLFLIMKSKMDPIWWSELMPLYFLLSSFFVGSAMLCLETELARRAYSHTIPVDVLKMLSRVGGRVMIAYVLIRFGDLYWNDKIAFLFDGSFSSNMFWLEMVAGIFIPIAIIFSSLANQRAWLVIYGTLTVGGVILNRMNYTFTSMLSYHGTGYFPSIWEILISIGLVSLGCLIYCFIVENFNILGGAHAIQTKILNSFANSENSWAKWIAMGKQYQDEVHAQSIKI